MDFSTIKTIIKKELASFLNDVSSYVVIIVFLLLWEFLFFRNAFIVGESSLRGLFDLLPWLMIVLVPALTMGSVSRERDEGTLEVVLTQPIRETEFLIGKWVAVVIFISITVLFTFPAAFLFNIFGTFDWGAYGGQIIGAILFGGALSALGIYISTLFKSQIASLLVTAVVGFFLLIVGTELVTANLPLVLVPILQRLSFQSHFEAITRGVLDTRDIWYFVSVIAVFLGLAYLELLKRKFGNQKKRYASFQFGMFLFVGIMVLTNVIGDRIPGRVDLTQSRAYTLSAGTKQIMQNLPDIITITLYASGKLPPQYEPLLRETKDILKDLKSTAKSKLVIVNRDPTGDPEAATEAQSRGIQEVQFNVIGAEELQVKTGYLGLVIEYAGEKEVIPFINDVSDLEYQLVSTINTLTVKDKKTISVLTGHGEKSAISDLRLLTTELGKQFTIKDEEMIATGAAALILAGPTQSYDAMLLASIRDFISKGGNVLWLIDAYTISPETGSANPTQTNVNDILKEYGVSVDANVVYDTRSHEVVSLGEQGGANYVVPYPFWVRALKSSQDSPITAKIQGILVPWGSSLTLDEKKAEEKGYTLKKLITTSPYGGRKTGSFSITPNNTTFENTNLEEIVLAISLEPQKGQGGKMVVVGDSDFATQQFLQSSDGNGNFALSAATWLAQEDAIAAIGARKPTAGKLLFKSQNEVVLVKYGVMAIALLIPALYGFWRLNKRRQLARHTYNP